jgi:hypothetical protein
MNPAAVFLGVSFAVLAVLGAWVLGSSRMPLGVSAAPRATSAPLGTTVTLRSSPPGASVVVDGIVYGPTPTRIVLRETPGELPGPKRFRFVLRGYEEVVVSREVRGDSMEIEAPRLRALRTDP